MSNPHLSKIRIYPVKSLDPIELTRTNIGIHSLQYDREFAMVALDGKYVNGKRTGRVNHLKAEFDLENGLIELGHRNGNELHKFELRVKNELLEAYLSDFFETKIVVAQSSKGELLDMPIKSSVTILSDATLNSLQADLNDASLENLRLRFRANLELSGVDAYWEEQLYKGDGLGLRFRIGDVEMIGVSPRARCNVPPKDPHTGEIDKGFMKKMMQSRAENLPTDSLLPNYGHFYHLTVNTYLPETEKGKVLNIGDEVEILEAVRFIS